MCSPHLGALQTLHYWDFFMEASSPGIVVVQVPGHVRLFAAPWTAAHSASLSSTISQRLFKLRSLKSVMPANHLILCLPLLFCLQSFPASRSLALFPALSPFSREWGERGSKHQASNHRLVFLVTGAIQEPMQGCLIRAKDTPISQAFERVLGALCQKPGSEIK